MATKAENDLNKNNYQKMSPAEITAKVEKLYKEQQTEEMLRLLQQGIKVPAHTIEPFIKDAVTAAFKSPKNTTFNSSKVLNNVNFENHLSSLFKIANFTPVYRHKFWGEFKDRQNEELSLNKKEEQLEKKRAFFQTQKKRKKLHKYLAEMEYHHAQEEKDEKKKNEELAKNSVFTYWVKDVLERKKQLQDLLKIIFSEQGMKKELAEHHLTRSETDKFLIPSTPASQAFQDLFLSQMKDFEEGKIKKIPQLDFLMAYAYLSSLEPGQKTRLTEEHIAFPELKQDVTYGNSTTVSALLNKEKFSELDINLFIALMKSQTLQLLNKHQLNNDNENTNENKQTSVLIPDTDFGLSSSKSKEDKENELSLVELARENSMSPTHIAQIQAINSLIENISSNTNLTPEEAKGLEDTRARLAGIIQSFSPSLSSKRGSIQINRATNQSSNLKNVNNVKVDINEELSKISKNLIQFQEEYYINNDNFANNQNKDNNRRPRPML